MRMCHPHTLPNCRAANWGDNIRNGNVTLPTAGTCNCSGQNDEENDKGNDKAVIFGECGSLGKNTTDGVTSSRLITTAPLNVSRFIEPDPSKELENLLNLTVRLWIFHSIVQYYTC